VYLAMLTGPPIAGIVLTRVVDGADGLNAYRQRLFKWNVDAGWYAVALLTAPLVLTTTLIVLSLVSSDWVPALLETGMKNPAGPIRAGSWSSLVLLGLVVGIGAGFFEELGWTGFATPALRKRHSVVASALMIGVVWGAWHFLAIWWGSADATGSVPTGLFMMVALFSFLPPYRVLMTMVYERTGSLLIGILMHASLTSSMLILGPAVSGMALLAFDLAFAAALWAVVALAVTAQRTPMAREVAISR
jgi:membrane protease YdiL (CAAX protease family)